MSATEVRRRRSRDGVVSETVDRWHDGPGSPGGRTYTVLYVTDGRVRVDVTGAWSGLVYTVWLKPGEARPAAEWAEHLKITGRIPVEPRWCAVDGFEIPQERIEREIPGEPEDFCSIECTVEARSQW